MMEQPRYGHRDRLETFDLPDDGPGPNAAVTVTARALAYTSTHRTIHSHDTGPKCGACRWLELTLYRTAAGTYILHTAGMSDITGEKDRFRTEETTSAYEILEILTQRKEGQATLPRPSARIMAQAAAVDDDLREAFVERAVA